MDQYTDTGILGLATQSFRLPAWHIFLHTRCDRNHAGRRAVLVVELIVDDQAHAVAHLQKLRTRWAVGGPDRVHAHIHHHLQLASPSLEEKAAPKGPWSW